jgi:hypothetical protein
MGDAISPAAVTPDRQDCWRVFYGDVCVGTIARRAGVPTHVDQWEWRCGFLSGHGARSGSERNRPRHRPGPRRFPALPEGSFQEWRDQRDWTARKFATWARGERLPSQKVAT